MPRHDLRAPLAALLFIAVALGTGCASTKPAGEGEKAEPPRPMSTARNDLAIRQEANERALREGRITQAQYMAEKREIDAAYSKTGQ